MRSLCIVSEESIIAGSAVSGVGEVVDSLAVIFSKEYAVSVVCKFGGGSIAAYTTGADAKGITKRRLFGVDYYMIEPGKWDELASCVVSEIHPDIFHNWSDVRLLHQLETRPSKTVYTIDDDRYISYPGNLIFYDYVTTVSEHYAADLRQMRGPLGSTLRSLGNRFVGVTNGVLSEMFSPEQKVLTPASYSADDLSGKRICKQRLCEHYGIGRKRMIFLMAGRMVRDKGIHDVLNIVPYINSNGGVVIFYGKGAGRVSRAQSLDGAVWIETPTHPARAVPMLAGSDFLLYPSLREPCGLMPMTACRFGTVPITTRVGGLMDNMTNDISIDASGGLAAAVRSAIELFKNQEELEAMRSRCMKKDFSWNTRKKGYEQIYEASGSYP